VSDIRTEIRDAFEMEQSAFPPPAAVRAQVIAAVSAHARASEYRREPGARNLTWLMGAAAVLLAIAIVAGLMAGRLINSHPTPVQPGPGIRSIPAGSFASVSMMSATSGWADIDQNGDVKRTTDGGVHWSDVSPPAVFVGGTSSAYFLDANQAWVVDASWASSVQLVSQRTIDGGRSWQQGGRVTFDVGAASSPDQLSQGGLRLDFLDSEHGWLFVAARLQSQSPLSEPRRDALYSTSDGGFHWRLLSTNAWSFIPAPLTSGCPWGAPVFVSLTTGFMILPDRTYEAGQTSNCPIPNHTSLHVTHDGGVTWQFQPLAGQFAGSPAVVDGPDFVDQLHGFLNVGSSLLATSDGGSSWELRSLPVSASNLYSISWLDARNGWATSAIEPLYRSRDGGATWAPVQTNLLSQTPYGSISGVYFVDQDTGFAFYSRTDTGGYIVLLKTTDGGRTWTAVGPVK
jgi:photosystem II stability/assembly factor-like uncharacterized protein